MTPTAQPKPSTESMRAADRIFGSAEARRAIFKVYKPQALDVVGQIIDRETKFPELKEVAKRIVAYFDEGIGQATHIVAAACVALEERGPKPTIESLDKIAQQAVAVVKMGPEGD